MAEFMPDFTDVSGPSVLGLPEDDFNAEVTTNLFKRAVTPGHVVQAWQTKPDFNPLTVRKDRLVHMAGTVVDTLQRLGLDLDASDDRIETVLRGVDLIGAGGGETYYGPVPFNMTGCVFSAGMLRLVNAVDPRSETQLKLVPQVHLAEASIPNLPAKALHFTKDPRFAHGDRYLGIASRTYEDASSPINGMTADTDTLLINKGGPRVSVTLPTGNLYAAEVRQIPEVIEGCAREWRDIFAHGALQSRVTVQHMRTGKNKLKMPLDTVDSHIDNLLTQELESANSFDNNKQN